MTQRTTTQNKCLHLGLRKLAEKLNDAGFEVNDKVVFQAPIQFTDANIKEIAFRPIMKALYPDKTSTTQLSTTEIQECWNIMMGAIHERSDVFIEWPSEEELFQQSQGRR